MLSSKLWSGGFHSPMNQLINSFRSLLIQSNNFSTKSNTLPISSTLDKNVVLSPTETNDSVLEKVNDKISRKSEGRLFAVVHLCGKQFKITSGDIILVEGYWPPNIGDKIRLDKVLVAGGDDFSFIGRPLVQKGLVDVQATIIEKTLTHTKIVFKKKRRKQYMRTNFKRAENTMVMINSINITGRVNDIKEVDNPLRIF